MANYGFFKEIGFDSELTIDDYKNNNLIIDKKLLIDFMKYQGTEWGILKVVEEPFTKTNLVPYVRQVGDVKWSMYLVDLVERNIYPPEEFQLFIREYMQN